MGQGIKIGLSQDFNDFSDFSYIFDRFCIGEMLTPILALPLGIKYKEKNNKNQYFY